MISLDRTPTRLIDPTERSPVWIEPAKPASRLRSVTVVVTLGAVALRLGWLRLRRRLTPAKAGQALREAFEQLGGLWIKTGQLLALRVDVFSPAFCDELAKLQHSTVGFPTALSRQILERELGAPVDRIFDEFGQRPFAVASIGQVFRAHLRAENAWVAVKIQRPYVADEVKKDFGTIWLVVALLQRLRILAFVRWDLGLQELRDVMQEELNYHYEASNIRRLRRSLKRHKIFVPKPYTRYCTERILVTEFIHGVLMADYIKVARTDPEKLQAWLAENNIKPRRVARLLMQSLLQQILEDNLYHGDLHPGNIVMLRDSRIALIDFGTASFTEREFLDRFRLFVQALAARDYSKAADVCFMLSPKLPIMDFDEVKEKLVEVLRGWTRRTLVHELSYHVKSLDNVTMSVMRVLLSYKCIVDWAWLRIHRAFTTLDLSLVYLYPDVNYSRMLQQYFERARIRSLETLFTRRMAVRVLDSYRTSFDIHDRVNEYTMFQGKVMRRQAQLFEGATDKFAAFIASIVQVVAICVLVVEIGGLIAFLAQYHANALKYLGGNRAESWTAQFPRLEYPVWIALLAVTAYIIFRLLRTARALRQRDVRQLQRMAPA